MSNNITTSPDFWKGRIENARRKNRPLRQAVYCVTDNEWLKITNHWKRVLKNFIKDDDRILDLGCGTGDVRASFPITYRGEYWGLDLNVEFIEEAQRKCEGLPNTQFCVGSILREEDHPKGDFDLVILSNILPMIKRIDSHEAADNLLQFVLQKYPKVLILEYDLTHQGEIVDNPYHPRS